MSHDLKVKGTSSFFWDLFGKLANGGMGFILTLFLARLLEPSEFGLIAIVLAFLGLISIFFDVGLSAALIQRKRLLSIHYSSVFYFNLTVSLVLMILVYIAAGSISDFYARPELELLVQVMSISFVLGALVSVQRTRLQKELNYKLLTKITIVSTVLSGSISIGLAIYGFGVWSLVVQNLLLGVLMNIFLWKVSRWRPRQEFSAKALRNLWRFGFHIFAASLLNAVFGRIDVLIAGKLVSPTVLGFYDRAKHLNQVVYSYSAGSLASVLFPALSKIQRDSRRLRSAFIKIYGILSFVIFALIGGFYLVSEELVTFLFSNKWIAAAEYFKIIVLSVFASVYSAFLVNVLISRGRSKLFFKIDIFKKVILLFNLYVGFSFGLKEYLYGYILASVLIFAIDLYFATKELDITMKPFIKVAIIQSLIGAFSVYIINVLSVAIDYHYLVMLVGKGLSFMVLYAAFSWIIKTDAWLHTLEELVLIVKKDRNV